MIKAVFMDIDNTLLDFDAAAQEGMERCFQDAGLTYRSEMFSAFKEENNRIWKKIEQGILTMDDLPYVRWQAILKKLGLEADGVAMEMLFRKCLFYSAVPVEGAEEILSYLHGKYILCTASNGPYEQQICRLKKADMLKDFDHCFVSEKIGVDKPDARFFERCLEQLPGIRAEECMIVGDSLTADIAGGLAAGMETCWFCRERIEEKELENVKEEHKADYVIKRLDELRKIMCKPSPVPDTTEQRPGIFGDSDHIFCKCGLIYIGEYFCEEKVFQRYRQGTFPGKNRCAGDLFHRRRDSVWFF